MYFSALSNGCFICEKTIEDETLDIQLRHKGSNDFITASTARGNDIHLEPCD